MRSQRRPLDGLSNNRTPIGGFVFFAVLTTAGFGGCGDDREGSIATPSKFELLSASAFTETSLSSLRPFISADGNVLVFESRDELWSQDLHTQEIQLLTTTSGGTPTYAVATFISSDGRLVGFQSFQEVSSVQSAMTTT